jgi:dipeptidyl aminopeptidase/acylaminoacyl peptidase
MIRRLATILAALCFAPFAFAADEAIPIESFFKIPEYGSMNLSPDGQHIAALAPVRGRQGLVVIDVKQRKATPIVSLSDRDIVSVEWINSKRMWYRTGRLGERDADQRGGATFAVDRDGSAHRIISEGGVDEQVTSGLRLTIRPLAILRNLPGETDDVIAQEFVFGGGMRVSGPLYRLDTRSGRKTNLSVGKPDTAPSESWLVDRDGVARVFTAANEEGRRIYYRAGPDAPWEKLAEFKEIAAATWRAAGISEDGRTIYAASRMGRDKAAIYEYNPETKTMGGLVAQHPQVDLGRFATDNEGIHGIWFNADRTGIAWLETGLAAVQEVADKAFPDNVNSLDWSRDQKTFLISSRSDVLPGSFYLYDPKTGKMEWFADSRPWIDPKKMSPMQPVRYKARDGLEVPAYLTVPKGSTGKNLPMVVMVHGGPWVDGDTWRFSGEVQFLASRGYAVLQPNFRGTTRYGWKHFRSSFMQWGLAMQDDVTDGVAWAVEQGIADPKRVCIYGGSYGGYAAMMGVAKTPEVFKCAVDYVGVTDLPLLMTASWSDTFNSEFARYSWRTRVGDIDKDIDRLKATSPVNLAARIKAPVMMAYGAADVRVIPEHGTGMKSALESAGNPPEVWMMVDGEGHGFQRLDNQVMFYGAMEKFLDKHIGH